MPQGPFPDSLALHHLVQTAERLQVPMATTGDLISAPCLASSDTSVPACTARLSPGLRMAEPDESGKYALAGLIDPAALLRIKVGNNVIAR